ncbi:MAG: carboxypeptidase regulatory-like domain-containing protein [Pirellulales bacterium]|nr:carboxypeptidase regulatory-like domain-containing protein [Pirellulales bacterium]
MKCQLSTRAISFLLVSALLFVSACSGPDIGQVSGKVTVNGKPLTNAHINFSSRDQNVSINANLNEDGTYVLKTYQEEGLPPGEYQVAIKGGTFGYEETPLVGQAPTASAQPNLPIPPRYSNIATSGLTAKVERGKNKSFDFDLK